MRRRLMFVGGVLVVLALLPMWKLVGVQMRDGSDLVARGETQRIRTESLPAARGSILDRNGVELAISVGRKRVVANMALLREEGVENSVDKEQFAIRLAGLLDIDAAALVRRLVGAEADDPWVRVVETVEVDVARRAVAEIERSGVVGALTLEDSIERVHPAGESALRVIGVLGADGPGDLAGIEKAYDDELTGTDGEKVVELGTEGETIAGADRTVTEPEPGSDVQLTLDRTLQHEVESILRRGTADAGAVRGIAVVGRPSSGELLAVASVQRDDRSGEIVLSDAPTAFSNSYQAGSVFKLVTVAAAVEAGQVDADTSLYVPPELVVDDRRFTDHESHGGSQMSVTQIVAKSSNVGTIRIAQELGRDRLHDALVGFGFGSVSGVGHPAESTGILPSPEQWTRPDLAASAIGTHQAATAMQLWAAYNVIANRGAYVAPRLVDSLVGPGGVRTRVPVAAPRQVVSESTAEQVGSMLEEVVRTGTGEQWSLPGYSVAAKTGTSRIANGDRSNAEDGYTWSDGRFHHVAAFTGYFPADRPQVSITVVLEDIDPGLTGSTAAGPVFSDLARLSSRELGIAPSVSLGGDPLDDRGDEGPPQDGSAQDGSAQDGSAQDDPAPTDRVRATPATPALSGGGASSSTSAGGGRP